MDDGHFLMVHLGIIIHSQWLFQTPKLEAPTVQRAYTEGYVSEQTHKIYQNMANNMVQYLHFWILKFPIDILTC